MRLNTYRAIERDRGHVPLDETLTASLFTDFDTANDVEIIGESDEHGRRTLRLKDPRHEEPPKGGWFIRHDDEMPDSAQQSSEAPPMLKLESHKDGEQPTSYYMTIDPKGVQFDAPAPSPPFPGHFLTPRTPLLPAKDAERFGDMEATKKQNMVLEALKIVEPRLQRLSVRVVAGKAMIQGDIGLDKLIPLPYMGDGINRLASLVLAIGKSPDGVVMVDEIENGLHHAILPKVWRAIGRVARHFNTQVFATTHSYECMAAAHKAFSDEEPYDFRLHRLERRDDAIAVVTYDRDTLTEAIDANIEVR